VSDVQSKALPCCTAFSTSLVPSPRRWIGLEIYLIIDTYNTDLAHFFLGLLPSFRHSLLIHSFLFSLYIHYLYLSICLCLHLLDFVFSLHFIGCIMFLGFVDYDHFSICLFPHSS